MKIQMTETCSGSIGHFQLGWVYVVDEMSLTQEQADEFIKVGHAIELVEEPVVRGELGEKKVMKKTKPLSVEIKQTETKAE